MDPNPPQETFVLASPAVTEVLADNGVDLVALLRQQGVAVDARLEPDPTRPADAGEKELVTVLLVSAALAAVLGPTITRVIGALTHRPVLVTETVAVPVEDAAGNVVRDARGNPVLQWVDRRRFVEPARGAPDAGPVRVEGYGLKIELGNTAGGSAEQEG